MTLFEYIYNLNTILNKNPNYANLNVIYSIDDEGNEFRQVFCTPSLGKQKISIKKCFLKRELANRVIN